MSIKLGVDVTNGRFADVTIEICKICGQKWIRYFVEFESFTASGRWYRGLLKNEDTNEITPETAITYLEGLDWYIYGGSYYSTTGDYGRGHVQADL